MVNLAPMPLLEWTSMLPVDLKNCPLNPEKNLTQIRLVVFEKNAKTALLIPKNDVTEPKAKLL